MVRNKFYVVRKLADVIYALPVGQGIVKEYPVMQLGALEYDIVKRIDQDESPRKVFEEMAISYMIPEEERDTFWDDFCTAAENLERCNIIQNLVLDIKSNNKSKGTRRGKRFR